MPTEIPKTPGVYCIWNKVNDRVYVGSAKDLNTRISKHFSPQCDRLNLKKEIKDYGGENFSVTWHETEDLFPEEQKLLDYVFTLAPGSAINVATKAGGNPGGTKEKQRELSLKGKSRSEWRELSEAGGSPKRVPLFLICTKTGTTTEIESSWEGARLGLGYQSHFSNYSKPNCLSRVKTCLVARSEAEAKSKLEAWLLIPGNDLIDNPIILELPKDTKQSALWKLAGVNQSHFSKMHREVLNPNTGEPLIQAMQSKLDFSWYGTAVKAGDWFRCTKSVSQLTDV
jgi:group I intron endonuclease